MNPSPPYRITLEWNDDDFYQDTMQSISRLPTPEVIDEKNEQALDASMACIREMGERLNAAMLDADTHLMQADIEFGIRLGAESGVLTKDNANAHFIVTLVWQRGPR